MKVYVDELPKSCEKCPFCKLDTYVDVYGYQTNSHECVLDGSMLTNSCPLQPLADHTKQVRKEVCDKFVEEFMLEYTMGNDPVEDIIYNVSERIQDKKNDI